VNDRDGYYYKNERRSDAGLYSKDKIDKIQAADRLKQIEIEKAKLQKIIDEKEALMKKSEQNDSHSSTKIKKEIKSEKSTGINELYYNIYIYIYIYKIILAISNI